MLGKIKKVMKKSIAEWRVNVFFKNVLLSKFLNDFFRVFFIIVPKAEVQFFSELIEVFVFFKKSLLPEHVNFMVKVGKDFFKFVIVELHCQC